MATKAKDEWEDVSEDTPATSEWEDVWEDVPSGPGLAPMEGEGTQTPVVPQGVFERRLEEAQGERPGLDTENEFGGPKVFANGISNPLSTVRDIADLGARGAEYVGAAFNTALEGMDEIIKGDAKDLGSLDQITNALGLPEIRPGAAIGALSEAFPLGGAEMGLTNPAAAAASAEYRSAISKAQKAFDEGATRADIKAVSGIDYGPELDKAIEVRDSGGKAKIGDLEETLSKEAQDFQANRTPEPTAEEVFAAPPEDATNLNEFLQKAEIPKKDTPVEEASFDVSPQTDNVITGINDLVKDWKDAPEFTVHDNFKDLEGIDPDAIGAVTKDGKILVNASKITEPETLSAVVFHEALGHNGMTKLFGDSLDQTLTNIYNQSTDFRHSVDKWIAENPTAYDGPDSIARAADEVLAEMSEKGILSPSIMNKIKNKVKQLARKMGIKREYSDREIETILGMAHDGVIKGKPVRENGFTISPRYMRDKDGPNDSASGWVEELENLGTGEAGPTVRLRTTEGLKKKLAEDDPRYMRDRKKTLSPDSMETQNDVSDLLDFTAQKVEKERGESYTIPELRRMADNMGLNASRYLSQKGLTEQQLASKLLAAKQVFTNTSDDLAGLGEKLRTDGYSPSLHAQIRQKLAIQEAVAAKLDGDTAEAGRALRVLREISQSKKTAEAQTRYMAKHGGEDVLSNPESLSAFMQKYLEVGKEAGADAQVALVRKIRKGGIVGDILNIPRTLQSSFDLSAPFRQGLFMVGRKQFWEALPDMFKAFASKDAYENVMTDIRGRPTYPLMNKAKLAIVDQTADISKREEQFLSKTASKLPGVKHSERAYNTFLNKVRADVFDDLIKKSKDAGINLDTDPKALRDIASFVNNATGRGELGRFEQSAPILTALFFSPRLIASRVNMLNPVYYAKLSPVVRKEAIKSLLSLGAIATTITTLAKAGGATVENDPRSSDFAKLKYGNTRYDILGGFGQYLTLGARLYTNEKKTLKGDIQELGKGYGRDNRLDIVEKFGENKLAPVPSYVAEYLRGKDPTGKEFDVKDSTINKFIPLFLQDIQKQYEEEGDIAKAVTKTAPAVFGVGIQTYGDKTDAKDKDASWEDVQ